MLEQWAGQWRLDQVLVEIQQIECVNHRRKGISADLEFATDALIECQVELGSEPARLASRSRHYENWSLVQPGYDQLAPEWKPIVILDHTPKMEAQRRPAIGCDLSDKSPVKE